MQAFDRNRTECALGDARYCRPMGQKPSQNSKANEVTTPAMIDAARRAARQAGGASYVADPKLRAVARSVAPPAPAPLDAATVKEARLELARIKAARKAKSDAVPASLAPGGKKQLQGKGHGKQSRKARDAKPGMERLLLLRATEQKLAASAAARTAAERKAADAAAARSAGESNRRSDGRPRLSKSELRAAAAAAWTATAALKEKGKPVVVVADETHRRQLERLGKMNRR